MKKRRNAALLLVFLLLVSLVTGCGKTKNQEEVKQNPNLDTKKKVTLTITGPFEEFKAIDLAAKEFSKIYPNCTINYEYVQNFDENMVKRLDNEGQSVDLFVADNIQKDSTLYPYALDYSKENMDLSHTFEGLVTNYRILGGEELYCIPLGAEVRGMYVNKTLLKKYDIAVPKNQSELLAACKTLKEAGYTPIQANPGFFAQQLLYPTIANHIANADDGNVTYDKVANCEEGVEELFRPELQFLYDITSQRYYEYKKVETESGHFQDTTQTATVKSFFNISEDDTILEEKDGTVPFMVSTMSLGNAMAKAKSDYHSNIDYEFILSPVTKDGGCAYVSPAKGIAINKNSEQKDWAVEFVNYLFEEKNNKEFAKNYDMMPNTKDLISYVSKELDVPEEQICQLGQVTFDYSFYTIITDEMVNISKANNPKYMKKLKSGKVEMYDFNYYMSELKTAFDEQRKKDE